VFAWRASKFITHWKRLSESSANSLELLEDRLSLLGNKVGPILFQLPPNFRADEDRLGKFFKMLSSNRRYSFEFRDPSWYTPRILKMLAERNISLACLIITTRRRRWKNRRLRVRPTSWSRRSLQRALRRTHSNRVG
jgi:uncharacterized protein YecE (DUF72 family)